MTVSELKQLLITEDDEIDVTICVNVNDDAVLWKQLNSSWHTADNKLVLGE